ncbi:MAG: helix-turn-helix transcriptional regulator [Candidatus Gastranaerophilales bacterium]
MGINNNLEKNLGKKLRFIRNSKKLSQMQLAEVADLNFGYIGQIERGKANITIDAIKKIADALEIEAKELFDFIFKLD